ncbi:uncharacterized protein N7446_005628 [Penicillium canescens]|uniref:uncharacterized protein n=1 Tax=Penicillium canescens TaxID=5083 RepID=UPI0026DF6765|nr:uncharacterized protein N7446_005628 [Penicillium canescens]KAJ6061508.1 hypothetical protein N7446_005628 [Penicillium canescens]
MTCRSLLLRAFQANLESCQKRIPSETQSTYIKSLGGISIELMQKYTKDNGMKNSLFINKNRSRGKLVLLARIVILSAKIFYSYNT